MTGGLRPLPIAYRGYTLKVIRSGRATETTHILWGSELIALVPTIAQARATVDDWLEAR